VRRKEGRKGKEEEGEAYDAKHGRVERERVPAKEWMERRKDWRKGGTERKLYSYYTEGLWKTTRGPLTEICSRSSELCWQERSEKATPFRQSRETDARRCLPVSGPNYYSYCIVKVSPFEVAPRARSQVRRYSTQVSLSPPPPLPQTTVPSISPKGRKGKARPYWCRIVDPTI